MHEVAIAGKQPVQELAFARYLNRANSRYQELDDFFAHFNIFAQTFEYFERRPVTVQATHEESRKLVRNPLLDARLEADACMCQLCHSGLPEGKQAVAPKPLNSSA